MKKKNIVIAAAVLIVAVAGVFLYPRFFPGKPERKILYWTDSMIPGDRSDHPGKSPMGMERTPVYADEVSPESTQTEQGDVYTCPMHPSVRQNHPGACPVCGMALVKKRTEAVEGAEETMIRSAVHISPARQVIANVSTTVARVRGLKRELRAVGTIQVAEPNLRHITTRFPGRIEKLFVSFTGEAVKKGDPVAEVYSPEAISAQQEFLIALKSSQQVGENQGMLAAETSALLEQSREKLLRWGFTAEQIAELQARGKVSSTIEIYSPVRGTVLKKNVDPQQYVGVGENLFDVADLSTVWLIADFYEYDMQSLKLGQAVVVVSDAYPGERIAGKVTFISPSIDPSARTVQVRVELPNPRGHLKVDMFVNAIVSVDLPPAVVVPVSAVLSTGAQSVVWVQKMEGLYEPRRVTLGVRAGGDYQILSGISAGDTVVTSGGYLIDSESQLEASSRGNND